MKKALYANLIFLFAVACTAQPQPTQDVAAIVKGTLTAIAQPQGNPPRSEQPTLQATVPPPPQPGVQLLQIELQQGARPCTNDGEYIISAKMTGAANTEVSYTIDSGNNGGTVFADGGTIGDQAEITLDNNGEKEIIAGIRGPFSDPENVHITISVLVNGQAVNRANGLICQGGEYKYKQ